MIDILLCISIIGLAVSVIFINIELKNVKHSLGLRKDWKRRFDRKWTDGIEIASMGSGSLDVYLSSK